MELKVCPLSTTLSYTLILDLAILKMRAHLEMITLLAAHVFIFRTVFFNLLGFHRLNVGRESKQNQSFDAIIDRSHRSVVEQR